MIALWLISLPGRAQSACPEDPLVEMERGITAIWDAFDRVDEPAFDRSNKALNAAVACLDVTPTPAQVSRLHQAMGLAGFVNGQIRASRRALAAARLLDPGWKITEEQFPTGHMFRDLYGDATDPGPVENIGKINPKVWIVDGVERDEAPTERAFLLQVREGDTIAWSGYLHDWEELPDFGQARARSVLEAPHEWWLSAGIHGGALTSRQTVTDDAVWQDQSATTFAGGADLTLRATPITVVGGEISASLVGPADPVEGGGGLPSGHAVVLLGGAGWVGGVQPWAAARIGAGVDRLRTWTNGSDGPRVELWTLGSLVAGLEAGVRSERHRVGVLADGRFVRAREPYQLRIRADGGGLVVGPLALEGLLEVRTGGLPAEDGAGVEVGRRSDLDLRVGGGIALWR